jgi:exosortase A-associated hydrolase 2
MVNGLEEPFFFQNSSYHLFGIMHNPEEGRSLSNLNGFGAIFCHPFAEEKLIAHRVMVNMARSLTREGAHCLRFDFMGHGDSEGNFENSTIATRLSDIHCAMIFLRKKADVGKLGLIGLRFGGTLAAIASSSIGNTDSLVLVAPIVDGKAYIDNLLRSNLATQMATYKKIVKDRKALVEDLYAGYTINIDGYLLSKELYEQIDSINLLKQPIPSAANILIIPVIRNEKQPIESSLKELLGLYRKAGRNVGMVPVQEDYFWTDTKLYKPFIQVVQKTICDWLKNIHTT